MGNKNIKTTLGQLNFFKWAISNGVLDYVEENLKQIRNEMKLSKSEEDKIKKSKSNL